MKTRINGVQIAYEEQGQGPAVLLIHGFPLCRQMWRPQIEVIASAGYRVIAPDLRGFGESEAPEEGYSMDQFADDLAELMDHLGIGRAVVGGMSMGGYILLNMLERHPRRIAAAAFLQTKPAADDESARNNRTALVEKVKAGHPEAVADTFTDLIFAPGTLQQRPELVRQVRQWMLDTPPASLSGALLAMRERRDYGAELAQVTVPSLVIGGAEDRIISTETTKAFAAELPRATSCLISGAGHMANLEQPEEFNRCLLGFLEK